jgi:hypothetical protein
VAVHALLVAEIALCIGDHCFVSGTKPASGRSVVLAVGVLGFGLLLILAWIVGSLLRQRCFQFQLRTLLLLPVIVAIVGGRLSYKMDHAARQAKTVHSVREFFFKQVYYDYEYDANNKLIWNAPPPGPTWLRNLLGVDFLSDVVGVFLDDSKVDDEWCVNLRPLHNLKTLDLSFTRVGDAGLEHVQGLSELRRLHLYDNRITDAGLASLERLTRMEDLCLVGTQTTDAGLLHLQGMQKLESLNLVDTQVTSDGMKHLSGLANLKVLRLAATRVGDSGMEPIGELPKLEVLDLSGTEVTDIGVSHITGLTTLRVLLLLDSTRVTDASVVHLRRLENLKWLDLSRTSITDEGVRRLQDALPNCEIGHESASRK